MQAQPALRLVVCSQSRVVGAVSVRRAGWSVLCLFAGWSVLCLFAGWSVLCLFAGWPVLWRVSSYKAGD